MQKPCNLILAVELNSHSDNDGEKRKKPDKGKTERAHIKEYYAPEEVEEKVYPKNGDCRRVGVFKINSCRTDAHKDIED